MAFSGINYWAVLVAGLLGFGLGGVWYRLLANPWKTAHGFTTEQIRAHHGKGAAPWPLIVALAADLLMAWMLAGVIGHLGAVSVKNGVIAAFFLWLGFVITTLAVNNTFGMRKPLLIAIDGGHWLAALLLMGAVIGAWGV
ncbi:MAG: DUF1761 domain-containing protein [Rhizobiales bacterium]|nr:DUF1761 domain-containing protein [Hyphomicrobiales bacterium]